MYLAPIPSTHPPIQLPHHHDEQLLDTSERSQINHMIISYININLLSEAEIWELLEYVRPKIKAEWKQLAYCMRYTVEEVEVE